MKKESKIKKKKEQEILLNAMIDGLNRRCKNPLRVMPVYNHFTNECILYSFEEFKDLILNLFGEETYIEGDFDKVIYYAEIKNIPTFKELKEYIDDRKHELLQYIDLTLGDIYTIQQNMVWE